MNVTLITWQTSAPTSRIIVTGFPDSQVHSMLFRPTPICFKELLDSDDQSWTHMTQYQFAGEEHPLKMLTQWCFLHIDRPKSRHRPHDWRTPPTLKFTSKGEAHSIRTRYLAITHFKPTFFDHVFPSEKNVKTHPTFLYVIYKIFPVWFQGNKSIHMPSWWCRIINLNTWKTSNGYFHPNYFLSAFKPLHPSHHKVIRPEGLVSMHHAWKKRIFPFSMLSNQ